VIALKGRVCENAGQNSATGGCPADEKRFPPYFYTSDTRLDGLLDGGWAIGLPTPCLAAATNDDADCPTTDRYPLADERAGNDQPYRISDDDGGGDARTNVHRHPNNDRYSAANGDPPAYPRGAGTGLRDDDYPAQLSG
jgi:hypothetical protein